MKLRKNELFYYIGVILLELKMCLFISNIISISSYINTLLTGIIIIMFLLKIIMSKNSLADIITYSIIGLIFFMISYNIGYNDLFLNILVIISSKNVDLKKTIKLLFICNFIFILFHLLYSITNYSDKIFMYDEGIKRYNFYMRHTNYFAAVTLWTFCSYIYLHINDKKNYFLIIILSIIVYNFTRSVTTLLAFIVLFILLIVKEIYNKNKKSLSKVTFISFCILTLLSLFLIYFYGNGNGFLNNLIQNIDELVSHRIKLGAYALKMYGFTMFGQKINYLSFSILQRYNINNLFIDSFYISCFIEYGISYLIVLALAIYYGTKKMDNNDLIFIILFIFVSFSERYVIYSTLVFPLLFFSYIFNKNLNNKYMKGWFYEF